MSLGARRIAALLIAGALALGACGSGAEYVQNKDAQTYFKVPKGWQAVRIRIDDAPIVLEPATIPVADYLRDGAWAVVVAPKEVNPLEVLSGNPDVAGGVFVIGTFENLAFGQIDNQFLRTIRLPTADGNSEAADPADAVVTREDDRVSSFSRFDEIATADMRGYHMRYAVRPQIGAVSMWTERVNIVHDPTRTFYAFQMSCNERCFAANQQAISEIFNTLRIRKDQP